VIVPPTCGVAVVVVAAAVVVVPAVVVAPAVLVAPADVALVTAPADVAVVVFDEDELSPPHDAAMRPKAAPITSAPTVRVLRCRIVSPKVRPDFPMPV
jgi:hypothetical protein